MLPNAVIVPLPNVVFDVALPTTNEVRVPVLVMFGCAFVVTVPAEGAGPAVIPVSKLPLPM